MFSATLIAFSTLFFSANAKEITTNIGEPPNYLGSAETTKTIILEAVENYLSTETDLDSKSWEIVAIYFGTQSIESLKKTNTYTVYASGKINSVVTNISCDLVLQGETHTKVTKIKCDSLSAPMNKDPKNSQSNSKTETEDDFDMSNSPCCNPITVDSNWCFDSYEEGEYYCK